ncbi:beta-lactamase family protein, partial [Saprospiraceae bacterium]|nr:beta-lactamase family protein [Saprospiraceae bacterium]
MNLFDPIKRVSLLSTMLFLTCISIAQTSLQIQEENTLGLEQSKSEKIDELVSQYVDFGKFNGTVLVAEKGKVIYKNGFGKANLEWNTPNKSDTKFRIASVTKQFTAMLIMQLVAENKLSLDKPISAYLPDYPKENGDKINLHHLLTHTSGIPSYTNFPSYGELMRENKAPDQLLELFVDSTLLFAPGERFDYSNSGYALLGHIIEKTTGKSFAEVLKEKIFEPLKMHNSGLDVGQLVLENRAEGYDRNFDYYTKATYIDMSVAYSAGGIYSTVEDLFLWDQALYTEMLLPKKYMDMIFSKQTMAWGEHYGYGWFIGEMRMGNSEEIIPTITHDGYINGFNTIITRIPSEKSSIILLNNNGGAPIRRMAQAIYGILHEKDYDRPKQSIAIPLLSAIK